MDTTIEAGTSLTLSVDVGGEGNMYTWVRDGINVVDTATTSSYTISAAAAEDAGTYICEVTNHGASQPIVLPLTMTLMPIPYCSALLVVVIKQVHIVQLILVLSDRLRLLLIRKTLPTYILR